MTRRKFERVLMDCGFTLDSKSKHEHWSDGQHEIVLSHGHADVPFYIVDQLRRLHPKHPDLKRSVAHGRGAHHGRDRHRQSPVQTSSNVLAFKAKQEKRESGVRPKQTRCSNEACGRLWMSDLDPVGRLCPACGAPVLEGSEDREREWIRSMADVERAA